MAITKQSPSKKQQHKRPPGLKLIRAWMSVMPVEKTIPRRTGKFGKSQKQETFDLSGSKKEDEDVQVQKDS